MNVIVIVTDSLRVDHLGCYGSEVETPYLDEFAEQATQFGQAYSEGLPTMPTRTAWWTGRFTFPFRGWQPLELDDVLLAEVLWDQGFQSALITDVYHMHKPSFNCGRGFDEVKFIRGQEYDPFIVDPGVEVDLTPHLKPRGDQNDDMWRARLEQYLRNISRREREEDWFIPQVANAAIEWLEKHRDRDNLFLWVDCFDPHEPWDPPEPYYSMYDPDYEGLELIDPIPGPVEGYMTPEELKHTKALYAGEVSFCDKWVGQILAACKEYGYWENSLIIHTSDHGEPFGEHGIVRKARPWCHEELVHIPWLLRLPGGTGAGRKIDAFVETCDLMPTVLDFLAVAGPEHMHGRSLLPLIRGEQEKVRDYAYSGFYRGGWSIRNHDWSLVLFFNGKPTELYDRRNDPTETTNVIAEHKDVATELEVELRRFVDDLRRANRGRT